MTFPAPDSSSFAGTAITVSYTDDAFVSNSMILGFETAISISFVNRARVYNTYIDCNNGVYSFFSADIIRLENVHCWPFATVGQTSAANHRTGNAFYFTHLNDWTKVITCFSYGYFRGFYVDGVPRLHDGIYYSPNEISFIGCGADNTQTYTGSIGFLVTDEAANTTFVGCQAAAQSNGFYFTTTKGVRMSQCDAWGNSDNCIVVDGGPVVIFGGACLSTPAGITVTSGSTCYITGVGFSSVTTPTAGTTAMPTTYTF
jgi:hypothetical protein